MSSQVRIQPPSGLCSLAAFQLADLAQRGLADLLGQIGGLDAGPVIIRSVGFALAEFLADGRQLLAQQELLLLLVHAGPDVLGDLVVDLDFGQVIARPVDQLPQPTVHVFGLQELTLLHVGQVRRVAGRIGQRRRIGDLVDDVDDLPGLPALQHRQQQLLVLRGQRLGLVGRFGLGRLAHLDPQRRAGSGGSGSDVCTAFTADDGGGTAAGNATDLHDRRDHAVGGVAVVKARGDQQLAGVAGLRGIDRSAGSVVEFDRDHHAGQHDRFADEQHRHRDWFSHQSSKVESDALNPGQGCFVPIAGGPVPRPLARRP